MGAKKDYSLYFDCTIDILGTMHTVNLAEKKSGSLIVSRLR